MGGCPSFLLSEPLATQPCLQQHFHGDPESWVRANPSGKAASELMSDRGSHTGQGGRQGTSGPAEMETETERGAGHRPSRQRGPGRGTPLPQDWGCWPGYCQGMGHELWVTKQDGHLQRGQVRMLPLWFPVPMGQRVRDEGQEEGRDSQPGPPAASTASLGGAPSPPGPLPPGAGSSRGAQRPSAPAPARNLLTFWAEVTNKAVRALP